MSDDSSKDVIKPEGDKQINLSPVSAILLVFLIYFGSQFLAAVVFVALSSMAGLESASQTLQNFVATIFSYGFMVLILWWFLNSRGISFKSIGLRLGPMLSDAGYGVIGYVVYLGLLLLATTLIIQPFTNVDLNQQQELGFDYLVSSSDKLMGLISLVVLPPIVEELVFRGFLFSSLRRKLSWVWTSIIVSVLFAAPHLLASSEGLLWAAGIDTLILSFVLCYIREKTGTIWAGVVVHAIKNSIAFMILTSGLV